MNYTECPECGNKQIIEYGEDTFQYERSARTGKLLRRSLGEGGWCAFKCRCGWDSYKEQFEVDEDDEGEDEDV
ncbi:hypothetical protein P8882_05505 [Bacillus haynesii]|nr:hypothetical protein [Bacillus haynesii]